MYITKEELQKRLTTTSLQINERERKVRGSEKRLTNDDRTFIGILSELDTQKNVAELTGVSQTTVSNNSRGLVGVSTGVDKELKSGVEKGIQEIKDEKLEHSKQIEDQLLTNLASALGHVANNITRTNAPEASKIAVDMSKILHHVTGDRNERGGRTAIIINVPQMKEEKNYQVMNV